MQHQQLKKMKQFSIRIMTSAHHRTSCRKLVFKKKIGDFNIPKPIYILIDEFFLIGNQNKFPTSSSVKVRVNQSRHRPEVGQRVPGR